MARYSAGPSKQRCAHRSARSAADSVSSDTIFAIVCRYAASGFAATHSGSEQGSRSCPCSSSPDTSFFTSESMSVFMFWTLLMAS